MRVRVRIRVRGRGRDRIRDGVKVSCLDLRGERDEGSHGDRDEDALSESGDWRDGYLIAR